MKTRSEKAPSNCKVLKCDASYRASAKQLIRLLPVIKITQKKLRVVHKGKKKFTLKELDFSVPPEDNVKKCRKAFLDFMYRDRYCGILLKAFMLSHDADFKREIYLRARCDLAWNKKPPKPLTRSLQRLGYINHRKMKKRGFSFLIGSLVFTKSDF